MYHLHAHDHSFKSDQVPECVRKRETKCEKCNDFEEEMKREQKTRTHLGLA